MAQKNSLKARTTMLIHHQNKTDTSHICYHNSFAQTQYKQSMDLSYDHMHLCLARSDSLLPYTAFFRVHATGNKVVHFNSFAHIACTYTIYGFRIPGLVTNDDINRDQRDGATETTSEYDCGFSQSACGS
eukprot:153899_1